MRYIVYFSADDYVSIDADECKRNGEYVELFRDGGAVAAFRWDAVLGWELKDK